MKPDNLFIYRSRLSVIMDSLYRISLSSNSNEENFIVPPEPYIWRLVEMCTSGHKFNLANNDGKTRRLIMLKYAVQLSIKSITFYVFVKSFYLTSFYQSK